ncbi:MAG: 6,7-dimethyl-8-ribityllumazine synthase [Nitrospina sp.]|nr:6,7-dimethyl-8-ribityllumazine synthase [Nitrospina sp.]
MVETLEGDHNARGLRVGVVVSRFNEFITGNLLTGALEVLDQCGVEEGDLKVIKVPGAFELPQAAKKLCSIGSFDAVICLGAVIRGDTSHFDYICAETSRGIGQVGLEFNVPVLFGVLTTENVDQAVARSEVGLSNKGREAAMAAIEMATLYKKL